MDLLLSIELSILQFKSENNVRFNRLSKHLNVNRLFSTVVVLVQPAGPLNIGSIARLCANFGIHELRLVAPCCNPLSIGSKKMAAHGSFVLDSILIYPDLISALADCRRIVACSGRIELEALGTSSPADAFSWLLSDRNTGISAVVFGREDRGLSNNELLLAGRILRLVTYSHYNSFNLSHAVAIVLYQLMQSYELIKNRDTSVNIKNIQEEPATSLELQNFMSDAEKLLLKVGFLYSHTASSRMKKLRSLLQRNQIRSSEVALLRGMVRQLYWATNNHLS